MRQDRAEHSSLYEACSIRSSYERVCFHIWVTSCHAASNLPAKACKKKEAYFIFCVHYVCVCMYVSQSHIFQF